MSIPARQVVDALKHRYTADVAGTANVGSEELLSFIGSLDTDMPADNSLLQVIAQAHSDWVLPATDQAVLAAIRDCLTLVFNLIDLEPEIVSPLRQATPTIATELIKRPALPFEEQEHSVLTILDRLVDSSVGWSADLGRGGEKLLNEVVTVVQQLRAESPDFEAIETELIAFLDKEQSRTRKLEERLTASEAGQLRSKKSRAMAAEMVNQAMTGNQLTADIAEFLKGPWFESMQLLAINSGVDGEDWVRAAKLTETIIWTYQPEAQGPEKQRLFRIIEHLPGEIKDLLLALRHNADEEEAILDAIEEDHIAMASGQELEYAEFELIEVAGESITEKPSVSRILLRKVNNLHPGQWFTYEVTDDGKHTSTRIKLVLKLDDVKQMMFTNRNGMKALDISFDEMAYLMSTGVIKALNHEAVFTSTFSNFFSGLVEEHERKQQAAEEADREAAAQEAARQQALEKAEAEAKAREEEEQQRRETERESRLERAKSEASKAENQEKVAQFTEMVKPLNTGAWLKLPAADGEMEECKLAVRVGDKMIFVNRTGVKVGEYTAEQLVTLLVAGEAEIDDAGVEFEDTLAQVVSKLRVDRTKSYDDLTGSE